MVVMPPNNDVITPIGSLPLLISDDIADSSNGNINFFSHTCHWNNEILSKIQMKYVSNSKELMLMMAGIHMLSPLPTAIIIDDFSFILDPFMSTPRDDPRFVDQVLITLAYVEDALHYIHQRNEERLRSLGPATSTDQVGNTLEQQEATLILTDSYQHPHYLMILSRTVHTSMELRPLDMQSTGHSRPMAPMMTATRMMGDQALLFIRDLSGTASSTTTSSSSSSSSSSARKSYPLEQATAALQLRDGKLFIRLGCLQT